MDLNTLKTRMDPWFFQMPFVLAPTEAELERHFDDALFRGDTEMIQYILEHNKTPRRIKSLRNYALEKAAVRGHRKLVNYLLSTGAKLSPVALTNIQDVELAFSLLPYTYPPETNQERVSILEYSARIGRPDLAQYFMPNGVENFNISDLAGIQDHDMYMYLTQFANPPRTAADFAVVKKQRRLKPGDIGSGSWARAMGDYYALLGTSPFSNQQDCMTKTYTNRDNIEKRYTKKQLYNMAKSMGLPVTKDMRKAELCAIISGTM